ncbi:MAG: Flp pilus assembly protein CpaB [Candidatus Limnocylindria bacterium]|nr:Flp pilus assembly protein CpaB [Candidatus Limnocylindria bacterium]
MIPRRWLFALAIAAGCLAAGLYYAATQRADVVIVARDIDVPRAITREDVEVRMLSAELVPSDAARRVEDVIGLVPRAPLLRGQLVLTRALAEELADFRSGLSLPGDFRAVAIPVTAVGAVGGAVVPGSRVDVLATPVLGRAPAGRATELLVSGAVVLDVRGESGAPFVPRDQKSATLSGDRIASVVLAIAQADEVRFADRIATSTFVLALASAK